MTRTSSSRIRSKSTLSSSQRRIGGVMEGASLGSRESFIGSCFILFVLAGVMGCRGARITFGRPSFGGDLGGGVLDSFIRNFSPLPTRLTPDRQESYSSFSPRPCEVAWRDAREESLHDRHFTGPSRQEGDFFFEQLCHLGNVSPRQDIREATSVAARGLVKPCACAT